MNFTRGFEPLRKRLSKPNKYTLSCFSCIHYQEDDSGDTYCTNPNVLPFDIVQTPTSIYCNRWQYVKDETKDER